MPHKKRRKSVSLPAQGDIGPDTPAQRAGAAFVELRVAGVVWRRKRRDHILQIMATGSRRRQAMISKRQAAAGEELLNRYEATLTGPGPAWTRVYVDSSGRPGDTNVYSLEAKRRFVDLSRHIPRDCYAVTMAVCCYGQPIRPGFTHDPDRAKVWLGKLRLALNVLADELRL